MKVMYFGLIPTSPLHCEQCPADDECNSTRGTFKGGERLQLSCQTIPNHFQHRQPTRSPAGVPDHISSHRLPPPKWPRQRLHWQRDQWACSLMNVDSHWAEMMAWRCQWEHYASATIVIRWAFGGDGGDSVDRCVSSIQNCPTLCRKGYKWLLLSAFYRMEVVRQSITWSQNRQYVYCSFGLDIKLL